MESARRALQCRSSNVECRKKSECSNDEASLRASGSLFQFRHSFRHLYRSLSLLRYAHFVLSFWIKVGAERLTYEKRESVDYNLSRHQTADGIERKDNVSNAGDTRTGQQDA